LRSLQYEGVDIESCDGCRGEWLDADELGKIVQLREERFDDELRRALAAAAPIRGVRLADVDRDLTCPACGGQTDPVNYGGDTGIILDRCAACGGFWVEDEELEKVQMLVEGWHDALPEDLARYGPMLRDVEVRMDAADDVHPSRIPLVGRFINTLVNKILDVTV
jgi:Zn-finger nucleic acid-binding protein